MFERKRDPVISRGEFIARMMQGLRAFLLIVGVLAYHGFEGMAWIDALLNAAMILGGMGPVGELHTVAGKLFASFYAIYSGLFLIAATGILLAPVFHRVLHKFHADGDDQS
jgi:hypothetical protein